MQVLNARSHPATYLAGILLGLSLAMLVACGGSGGGDDNPPPPPPPVNQAPTASFTATPATGTAPLTVAFDASASTDPDGTIAAYAWAFGDNSTGSGRTASHTFATAGTYSVRLTVTDNAGATASTTRDVTVTSAPPPVNQPPVAAFSATPLSGVAPLSVSFDAGASTDPDGTIASYAWTFGDNTTGTGRTVSHTYANVGTYTAQLTVTDNVGATAATSAEIRALAPSAQWLGAYKSSLIPEAPLYSELTVTGTTLAGSWKDTEGRTGTIDGTVAGSIVTLTLAETTPGCTGTFTGTGTLGSVRGLEAIEFIFSGTDCLGAHTNGVGQLIRQTGFVLAWGQRGPTSLTYSNGELFWTDTSREPLKKLVLATGATQVLAQRMRALTRMTVETDRLLWVDAIGDSNAYCTGIGVQQALMVSASDGSNVRMLAEGPACGGTVAPVSDGTYVYWVTSRTGVDAWRIERVPLAGGASSLVRAPTGFTSVTSLARDNQHLYWIEDQSPDAGFVRRCAFATCGQFFTTVFDSALIDMSTNLALTNDLVVFGARRYGPPSDRIITVPKPGGTVTDIATAPDFATAVVTDGTTVFWLDSAAVRSVPITGGAVMTLASGLVPSGGLSVDSQRVAWTERPSTTVPLSGSILGVAKSGGAIETLVANAASPRVVELAGNGALVYADGVIDYLPGSVSGIYRRTTTGSIQPVVGGIAGRGPIAVDGTHVYVSEGWWLKRVPRAGGTPSVVSQGSFYITALDLDATHVYWVEDDLGTVRRAPLAGGVPTFLSSGNGKPFDLKVRGGTVYWLLGLDKLLKVPVTGGTAETLASGLRAAEALVVDDSFAYFTESDAGQLSKVATAGGAVAPVGSIAGGLMWYALGQDPLRIFWQTPASVGSVAKDGSSSATLSGAPLSDDAVPGSVAADATYVYWAETLIGAIKRAPR